MKQKRNDCFLACCCCVIELRCVVDLISTAQSYPFTFIAGTITMPKKESELVSLHKEVSVEGTEEEEEEELLLEKSHRVVKQPTEDDLLLESSLLDDVFAAINDAKYIAPLVALFVVLVGIYLATDVFRPGHQRTPRLSHDEFVS